MAWKEKHIILKGETKRGTSDFVTEMIKARTMDLFSIMPEEKQMNKGQPRILNPEKTPFEN